MHHAKQQQSIPHRPLFYKRNEKAARLLHGMGDLGTLAGTYLTQGILLNAIRFSPPCAEILLQLKDYLSEYTPTPQ